MSDAAAFSFRWDPYPFILLNLAFSTQAAYAAPLILLAQTRQAERDKVRDATVQAHREAEVQNTQLTQEIVRLTTELHATICDGGISSTPPGSTPTR